MQKINNTKTPIMFKINSSKLLLFLFVSIVIVLVYTKLGLAQFIDYKITIAGQTITHCNSFLMKHPTGKYSGEIKALKDDLSFKEAVKLNTGNINCEAFDLYTKEFGNEARYATEVDSLLSLCRYKTVLITYKDTATTTEVKISEIDQFLKCYPESYYYDNVILMRDTLWNGFIAGYNKEAKSKKTNKQVTAFFNKLLAYLKIKDKNKIYVQFDKKLQLRDWADFSIAGRKYLDKIVEYSNANKFNRISNYSGESMYASLVTITKPSESPPPSLKKYFDEGNINSLQEVITYSLQNSFYEIFSTDFFTVQPAPSELKPDDVVINISYTIKNKTEMAGNIEIPSLYQKFSEYKIDGLSGIGTPSFDGHLLGVNISWGFKFKIPETEQNIAFSLTSNPAENIKNVSDISDAYRKMMETTFQNFTELADKKMGID